MIFLEAFKRKGMFRRERDVPQAKRAADDVPQGGTAPSPTVGEGFQRLALLTPREHDLFLLLLEGYTLKEAAKQLSVKYSTANTHITGIYKKLNVKSRAELIIRYRDAVKGNE